MHKRIWWHQAGWAGLVGMVLTLTTFGPARADLFLFKDGFVVEGKIRQEGRLEFDRVGKTAYFMPKGLMRIEDGPRRVYFPQSRVVRVDKTAPPPVERLVDPRQPLIVTAAFNPPRLPPVVEVLRATAWDAKWTRTFTYRSDEQAEVTVPQRLGLLTPYYAQVDVTRKYKWSSMYLTRAELGLGTVQALLATHPDLQEKEGMAPGEVATRRLRRANFYYQAGWYDQAVQELDRLLKDQPDQKERIEAARAQFNARRTREHLEDLKRLYLAGRYEAVQRLAAKFPEQLAEEKTVAGLRTLRNECDSALEKTAEARRLLQAVGQDLTGARKEVLARAAEAIRNELNPAATDRLELFVGQARLAYPGGRVARSGDRATTGVPPAPDRKPEKLLSLAITSWLLGSGSAETDPETAVRLWRAREMVLAYLREKDVHERHKLLAGYLGDTGRTARLDEIAQMIPNLPPPEAAKKAGTDPVEVKVDGRFGRTTYHLQLPPEYHPGRHYPVLIALHHAGEKPSDMLDRFRAAAAANGYLVAAPAWEQGLGGEYTYDEAEHAAVLDTLRDLRRRFQVDSDRVFLFGLGEGGKMAFDVGLSHPDLFAGVLPMAAAPAKFAARYFRNGRELPFYVVSGNCASVEANKLLREVFTEWITRGYPMLWVEYPGRGVEWFAGEVHNLFDWMRNQRRAFPLERLGTSGNGSKFGNEFSTMRPGDNRFYWLSTSAISPANCNTYARWNSQVSCATLTARVDAKQNVIHLQTSGIKQVTVWVGRNREGANLIDFDRPLTIDWGFPPKWANRKVTPSLATLLEDLYQRGDRQQLFLAKIELN